MTEKADYVICSAPVCIVLDCPKCDHSLKYNWAPLEYEFEAELYYGNCGTIKCKRCGHDIELGEARYD